MKHEKKLKVYVSTPMIGVTGSLYLVDIKFSDASNLLLKLKGYVACSTSGMSSR